MQRRSFLQGLSGILATGIAPAIVAQPMKIFVPKEPKINLYAPDLRHWLVDRKRLGVLAELDISHFYNPYVIPAQPISLHESLGMPIRKFMDDWAENIRAAKMSRDLDRLIDATEVTWVYVETDDNGKTRKTVARKHTPVQLGASLMTLQFSPLQQTPLRD
jgi:hypothetical protein